MRGVFMIRQKRIGFSVFILIALAVSAADSKKAQRAMACLPDLCGAEVHSTVILSQVDIATFRKLGLNLTCEPNYQTKKLFHI